MLAGLSRRPGTVALELGGCGALMAGAESNPYLRTRPHSRNAQAESPPGLLRSLLRESRS
jgi:hypothetical protein